MNIERDSAIVLRVVPFSETSSVLTWFSARRGRLATLAKGSRRPRSRFLGQADLMYTCEILYYPGRAGRRLAILKDCAPLKIRGHFRADWRAMLCGAYAASLIDRLCPDLAPHPPLYRLLDNLLDGLDASDNRMALIFWFELRVLSEMGLAPRLSGCVRCGSAPGEKGRRQTLFSAAAGGLLCANCAGPHGADARALAPDILALLHHWQRTADAGRAGRTVTRPSQTRRLDTLLGGFLRHHLEGDHPGRGLALRHA